MNNQLSIWVKPGEDLKIHHPLIMAPLGYMPLCSMRLFLAMLKSWDFYGTEHEPIKVPLYDIIPGFKGGTHCEVIQEAVTALLNRMKVVKIETVNAKGVSGFEWMSIIDSLKYEIGDSFVTGFFGRRIQQYLRELKGRFSKAELNEIIGLKSTYAIRFFLIGKMFYPGFEEIEISLDEFKAMLIGGGEQYKLYKHFKSKIINPSLVAIASTSGAMVMQEKRTSHQVTSLVFRPAKAIPHKIKASPLPADLLTELKLLKVNVKKIEEMLNAGVIDVGYIQYVIAVKKKDTTVKKLGAAIYTAVTQIQLMEEYFKPKAPVLTPPKVVVPTFKTEWIEETRLKEMHEINLRKIKGTPADFSQWVQEAFIHSGFIFHTNQAGVRGVLKEILA